MSEETKIPQNHVVGVVTGDSAIDKVKDAVQRKGYEEVLVMERVDATGEGVNPIMGFIERLAGHLSDEVAYIDQYKEQTEAGGTVVAVKVDNREQAEDVKGVMELHGAVNVRFFGRFAVSDLTPATNPSAPSDERP